MNTRTNLKVSVFFITLFVTLIPSLAFAHQPRIVDSRQIVVPNPEISKAYYGQLTGVPDVYFIQATTSFNMYVGILVPDIPRQKQDVSAIILKDGIQIALLDASKNNWKPFFEEFGHDAYLQGPEFKTRAEAGAYEIRVSSGNNDSKYSLAIGEIEAFDLKEGMNALTIIPQLKKISLIDLLSALSSHHSAGGSS